MPNPRHQETESQDMAVRSLGRSNEKSPTKLAVDVLNTHPRAESVSETDSPDRSAVSEIEERYPPRNVVVSRQTPVERVTIKDEPDEFDRYDGSSFVKMPAYANLHTSGNARAHFGSGAQVNNNYYNVVNSGVRVNVGKVYGGKSILDEGFDFSMSPYPAGTTQHSASSTAIKNRARFTSKKRPALPALLDHQEAYKSYTEVTNPAVRQSFVQIARLFTDLDEFFAAMFVHIIMASEISSLRADLEHIRHEISTRQTADSPDGDDQDAIYVGDLGRYCEKLLEHHRHAGHDSDDTKSPPEFTSTHSDEQSWLDYLEDGFEIPYWKMMLDAFSTSRLNKPTIGGKMISTALISMRADILNLRYKLKETLDTTPDGESLEGIVSVVDKRINILRSFTDRVVSDRGAGIDGIFNSLLLTAPDATAKPGDSGTDTVAEDVGPMDQTPSASDPLLLVTLILLTLIGATVPFAQGFKASTSAGTTSDADFWLNISSSIFTIMANFVMIIQLTHGSRFSKQYIFVWIWFFIGILCAGISMAIYPFFNTAWSSLLSFFAAIAGFGATLSVTMTVEKPRSAGLGAKKKID